jgi:hypothetical protein
VTAGSIRFQTGASGASQLTLIAGGGVDRVVFASSTAVAGGAGSGYSQIANFQSGTDQVLLTGTLRTAADRNGDGVVQGGARAAGAVDMAADEVDRLSAAVTLTTFTTVATAIGTLLNSSSGASVVVLANDGSNSGLYLVTDADGDGAVLASEIRLLGVFSGLAVFGPGDVFYG